MGYNDHEHERQDNHLERALYRIERKLDIIIHREAKIMSAVDDLTTELQGVADEGDAIAAGIKALIAGQKAGNQAAVDAAVAQLKTAADNMKSHVDAAQSALTDVPVDPGTGGDTGGGIPPAPGTENAARAAAAQRQK